MKYETEAACLYWLSCIDCNNISQLQENSFLIELQSLMRNKFANHWYEHNPLQGQGFRSMICNIQNGNISILTKTNISFLFALLFQILNDSTFGEHMFITASGKNNKS